MSKNIINENLRLQSTEEQNKQQDEIRRIEKIVKDLFNQTFSSQTGLQVLKMLIDEARIMGSGLAYDNMNKIDNEKTLLNEGKKLIVLKICSLVSCETLLKAQQVLSPFDNVNNKQ